MEPLLPRTVIDPPISLPPLDRIAPEPLHRQLHAVLRAAILDGRLKPGARLPSTRHLAQQLGIGRNTALAAFEDLAADGFLVARPGSGSVVAEVTLPSPAGPAPSRPLSRRITQLMTVETPRARGWGETLAVGTPDVSQFPFRQWGALLSRRWRRPDEDMLAPSDAIGYRPLRQAIADWLGRTRALRCSAEQVLIVSGSQQALDLCARVLLDPGTVAMVEDPGYGGLKGALRAAGAEVAAVPVDQHGFDVELGERQWPDAKLACVTPSHQFPTGVVMPLARRLALIEWAQRNGGWIVEDDYDGEFRQSGTQLAALQGLDPHHRTIHLGTFSKSMFPGLRLGWLVLPDDLMAPFTAARRLADMAPPSLTQAAMADFMAEGLFARHLKRMRALYANRRAAFAETCRRQLAHFGTLAGGEAGLHSVLWLAPGTDDRAAAARARAAGLAIRSVSEYRLHPGPPGLVLGWSNLAEDRMDAVIGRLAAALSEAGPPPPR